MNHSGAYVKGILKICSDSLLRKVIEPLFLLFIQLVQSCRIHLFRFTQVCLIAVDNYIVGVLASKVIYRHSGRICQESVTNRKVSCQILVLRLSLIHVFGWLIDIVFGNKIVGVQIFRCVICLAWYF